jgi:hypothetical protein
MACCGAILTLVIVTIVNDYPTWVLWLALFGLLWYFVVLSSWREYGLIVNSERATLVLVGLLCLNYIALHSHTIEAFIEKATQ